jgi:putative transposase
MILEEDKYYHLYNRSNNREIVFKEEKNYSYFLGKYQAYCHSYFETLVFCLMPTHFHLLVKSISPDLEGARKAVALLLSSYTKAIDVQSKRHGSLFQPHTKAIEITDHSYLMTVISYIHQNPVRAGLVRRMENWPYSSYCSLLEPSSESWQKNSLIHSEFKDRMAFKEYSELMLENIRSEFWI